MVNAIKRRNSTINRDVSISFIRVTSMFMIIITHFISEIDGIAALAQITNAAVYTFLFISGYLFSKKEINNNKKWIKRRLTRLLVPSYIYLLVLLIYKLVTGDVDIIKVLIYTFNMQGLLGTTRGAGHFWFMTTIMLCYLITPVLYDTKESFLRYSKRKQFIIFGSSLIIWIIVSLITNAAIGNNIGYILFYTFSYYLGTIWGRSISNKNFILITIITLLSLIFRVVMRRVFDDTAIYDIIVVTLCQSVLGIYLFIFLDRLKFISNNEKIIKFVNHFDRISFEMFITHYAFIVGPFYIWGFTNNILIDSVLVLAATYISSVLLNKASNMIIQNILIDHTVQSIR